MYLPTKCNADRMILLPRIMEIKLSQFQHAHPSPTPSLRKAANSRPPRLYDHIVITTIFLPPKRTQSFIILKTSLFTSRILWPSGGRFNGVPLYFKIAHFNCPISQLVLGFILHCWFWNKIQLSELKYKQTNKDINRLERASLSWLHQFITSSLFQRHNTKFCFATTGLCTCAAVPSSWKKKKKKWREAGGGGGGEFRDTQANCLAKASWEGSKELL